MNVDFLDSGSEACPLIRLHGFAAAEATKLRAVISSLAARITSSIALEDVGLIRAGGCRLFLLAAEHDAGVLRRAGTDDFECALTPERWDDIAALIEPFASGATGFQWLDTTSDVKWLLSADGGW